MDLLSCYGDKFYLIKHYFIECPCLHGGECLEENFVFRCQCLEGTTGDHCETNIDECQSNPCLRGNCVDMINRFNCDCPGYTGALCETEIDECESNPCSYGNCTDMFNAFSCVCYQGYEGSTCEGNNSLYFTCNTKNRFLQKGTT